VTEFEEVVLVPLVEFEPLVLPVELEVLEVEVSLPIVEVLEFPLFVEEVLEFDVAAGASTDGAD
jgi:hypothetical protein